MPQVLHLMNGEGLEKRFNDENGRLKLLLKSGKSDREIVDQLFLATLARKPSDEQWRTIESTMAKSDEKKAVLGDLMWALINSKEFLFHVTELD